MSLTLAFAAALCLTQSQGDPGAITWRTYKAGVHSSATAQEIVIMETPGDYQRYVRRLAPGGAGDGNDIDWKSEELVAIHIGERKTGGYSVMVSSIKRVNPRDVLVSWTERFPGKRSVTPQVVTSPYVIVRLNRTGGRLTFEGRRSESRPAVTVIPGLGWGCRCCEACVREHEGQLPWQVFAHGLDAPVLVASTFVMDCQEDYDRYLSNYKMSGLGNASRVDWSRDRLVAIHAGRQISYGYDVMVDRVNLEDLNRTDVKYLISQPSQPVLAAGSSTGPYVIIQVPRVGAVVSFGKRYVRDDQPYRNASCDCGCPICAYCGGR